MNYRKLLRILVTLLVILLVPVIGLASGVWISKSISNVGDVAFERPLQIPPLAESRIDDQGRRHFDLRARPGRTELLPGVSTETWGLNGAYLGPTLRASRGEQVTVDVHNDLSETTSLHWHGMELPAVADGGPHQPIEPGTTWSPSWTVDQPAATLWYHPHLHGSTAQHVYRGLAGMFLVDDANSQRLPIPKRYGVNDIPLIVQDKKFEDDGSLDDQANSGSGMLGDEILVNGTHGPHLDVTDQRIRLRVLNGSNARIFNLGFPDDREFAVIGTDTGLLREPVPTSRLLLSPGERAEIVVELAPAETVRLRSFEADLGAGSIADHFVGGDDTFDLLELRAAATLAPAPELPARLSDTAPIEPPADAKRRPFALTGRTINGRQMDMGRVDEVIAVGSVEIWEVRNSPGSPHNFHVHNAAFRVLDIDGQPPPAVLTGRKDTVYVPPGSTLRLAIEFGPHTDPAVPYMYHCHLLTHEDAGMMGQFVVVPPDQVGSVHPVSPAQAPQNPHRHAGHQ